MTKQRLFQQVLPQLVLSSTRLLVLAEYKHFFRQIARFASDLHYKTAEPCSSIRKLINSPPNTLSMKKTVYNFTVVIEKDEDGFYVGSVPALRGCHTQGRTMDELLANVKEAIELCLETQKDVSSEEFVGIQQVKVEK